MYAQCYALATYCIFTCGEMYGVPIAVDTYSTLDEQNCCKNRSITIKPVLVFHYFSSKYVVYICFYGIKLWSLMYDVQCVEAPDQFFQWHVYQHQAWWTCPVSCREQPLSMQSVISIYGYIWVLHASHCSLNILSNHHVIMHLYFWHLLSTLLYATIQKIRTVLQVFISVTIDSSRYNHCLIQLH